MESSAWLASQSAHSFRHRVQLETGMKRIKSLGKINQDEICDKKIREENENTRNTRIYFTEAVKVTNFKKRHEN